MNQLIITIWAFKRVSHSFFKGVSGASIMVTMVKGIFCFIEKPLFQTFEHLTLFLSEKVVNAFWF